MQIINIILVVTLMCVVGLLGAVIYYAVTHWDGVDSGSDSDFDPPYVPPDLESTDFVDGSTDCDVYDNPIDP